MIALLKRVAILIIILTMGDASSYAQCAMCRATLENNFSNGDAGIAAGINTGIIYLLLLPYLAILVVGYFWYKTSKNEKFSRRPG